MKDEQDSVLVYPLDEVKNGLFRSVGNTPLQQIHVNPSVTLFIKHENANPVTSHKDRIAAYALKKMLNVAKPGDTIVDASSGSYLHSLAYFSYVCGFRSRIFHSRSVLDISSFSEDWDGRFNNVTVPSQTLEIARQEALVFSQTHKNCWYVGQFDRIDSRAILAQTLGKEVRRSIEDVSVVISSVGTGGLLYGMLDVYPNAIGYFPTFEMTRPLAMKSFRDRVQPIIVENSSISHAATFCHAHGIRAGFVTLTHVAAAVQVAQDLSDEQKTATILTFATDKDELTKRHAKKGAF